MYFKILSIKRLNFVYFAQVVFKLLSGSKFDWILTVGYPSEISLKPDIIIISHITNFGHLEVNTK